MHREVASRRTLRFEVAGRSYFAKLHRGVGVGEILKNLVVLRRPVVDASNEYRACRHLAERGIAAPRVAGFSSSAMALAMRLLNSSPSMRWPFQLRPW